jgi:hypothetical protein
VSLYIVFLGGELLNFNIVIINKDFNIFLDIMITHYIKKSLNEKIILYKFILCDVKIYLFETHIRILEQIS